MEKQLLFVKIPKESSLAEIAARLKVDADYLKRYHNIYCELEDLIGKDLPKHLVKLYVPPKDETHQKHLMSGGNDAYKKPETALSKNTIFHRTYGVLQTTFENGKEPTKLSFLTEVGRTGNGKHQLNRKNIFINNKAPELIAEQIAHKLGDIFFPLEVETLENGNLKKISNNDAIVNRWKTLKPQLAKYYKAEAETTIANIDQQISHKSLIQNRIFNSLFYRLYFLPFRDYVKDAETEFDLYLPLYPFKNKVKFLIKLAEKPTLSKTEKVILNITGKCTDPRSYHQIINSATSLNLENQENQCSGTIEALYKFNKEDGSLFSANVEILIESKDQKQTKKIQFEMYQQ